jgi:hypothetical protein
LTREGYWSIIPIAKSRLIQHQKITDELGNTVETRLWKVPPATDKPHGFKYSLVYIVGGERVIGNDNGERRGDHRHYGAREETYSFTTLRNLAGDFQHDVDAYKRSMP